jgi:UDP-galactopyranose mutase
MTQADVIVVGAGISGLSFAESAAEAGRSVLLLDHAAQVGGCLASHRARSGYWFELGAHTCYNSYASLSGIIDRLGLRREVVARAKSYLRFLDGDRLVPGSNLGVLLRLFSWGELARSLPSLFTAKKDGQTVYSYYARIVGRGNYGRVLGPMLSAVPSQTADALPAAMLFKSRAVRRKDYPRSFTLNGGLTTIADRIAARAGIRVALGQGVTAVEAARGGRLAVVTGAGERIEAATVAIATPPATTATLLRGVAPELATTVARVKESVVETTAFAVRAERVSLPPSTFLIPRDDLFHSVVTRDSVPDESWRGFAFHYKPGIAREARLERARQVLKLERADLEEVVDRRTVLPSPVLGHEQVVAEVDRLIAGGRLAITGNWFAGLSLEDCVERSRQEWQRVSALG